VDVRFHVETLCGVRPRSARLGKGARFYPRKGLQASRIAAGVGPGLVGVSLTAF
jgi:hypothetical protein